MAKYVMKGLARKAGLEDRFRIALEATSRGELGNPVHSSARRELVEYDVVYSSHAIRQPRDRDYEEYDLLIGMDQANLHSICRICGGDPNDRIHLLVEYTGYSDQEVAAPWYANNLDTARRDVLAGCQRLF